MKTKIFLIVIIILSFLGVEMIASLFATQIARAQPSAPLIGFGGRISGSPIFCTVSNPLHQRLLVQAQKKGAFIDDLSSTTLDTLVYPPAPGMYILGNALPTSLPCISGTPLSPIPLGFGALIVNYGLGLAK